MLLFFPLSSSCDVNVDVDDDHDDGYQRGCSVVHSFWEGASEKRGMSLQEK